VRKAQVVKDSVGHEALELKLLLLVFLDTRSVVSHVALHKENATLSLAHVTCLKIELVGQLNDDACELHTVEED